MRKLTLLLVAMLFTFVINAQNSPIDFETSGYGASWTWNVFENDTNPPLQFIANPDASGINTSATVAKFIANQAGNPWAGTESAHGTGNLGNFVLDSTNSTIKIKVWKTVISDVGIKLVSSNGWAQPEKKVANTLINQWEEITFDFSSYPNPPASEGMYDQIVVFPDFDLAGRAQSNTVYFDDITFNPAVVVPTGPSVSAPVPPVRNPAYVVSVFSDAYANVAGTDFNPNWGQSTIVTMPEIQNDTMLKYANLNYQGTGFASPLGVSGMGFLHIDMWTADATAVNFFLISTGPVEKSYALPITPAQWVSYDIPVSTFTGVDLNDVIQFKVDGGTSTETIYLDNIYFYIDDTSVGSDMSNDNTLVVFPNPVTAGQKVKLSTDVNTYNVYDIAGKLVMNGNNTEFSTENLNRGMYFIVVDNNNGSVQTQKLIVK